MKALRDQIAALELQNEELKSVEEGLGDLGAFPVMDKMNKELHAEFEKNQKLQEEVERL